MIRRPSTTSSCRTTSTSCASAPTATCGCSRPTKSTRTRSCATRSTARWVASGASSWRVRCRPGARVMSPLVRSKPTSRTPTWCTGAPASSPIPTPHPMNRHTSTWSRRASMSPTFGPSSTWTCRSTCSTCSGAACWAAEHEGLTAVCSGPLSIFMKIKKDRIIDASSVEEAIAYIFGNQKNKSVPSFYILICRDFKKEYESIVYKSRVFAKMHQGSHVPIYLYCNKNIYGPIAKSVAAVMFCKKNINKQTRYAGGKPLV